VRRPAPVLQLAERAGLQRLIGEHLHLGAAGGVNAHLKIPCLIGGMVAGADSIDDMDLLRHGAMGRLFTEVRAPSPLGTFLRSFTFGHVRQLDAVASRLLINLAGQAPLLPARWHIESASAGRMGGAGRPRPLGLTRRGAQLTEA
jgi:hypothetical protein